jgi:hypothetical protein
MANQIPAAILSQVSARTDTQGRKWDFVSLSSPAEYVEIVSHWKGREYFNAQTPRWAGAGSQSFPDILSTGHATEPMRLFQEANAKLHSSHTLGGGLIAATCGGVWDIPSVIQGLPLSARVKPRTALPPKNLRVHMGISAGTRPETLAEAGAIVARALWDYALKGGVVSVVLIHREMYSARSSRDTKGLWVETNIPLTSESAFALAFSTVSFRFLFFYLAQILSPEGFNEYCPRCLDILGLGDALSLQDSASKNKETLKLHGIEA